MKWMPLYLLLTFFTATVLVEEPVHPATQKTTGFVAIGDMPYTDAEYALLQQPDGMIAKAIKTLNPPLLIHLGDFKKGRLSCDDERYKDHYRQIAALNLHKTVYTPGDNDWTDCDRFTLFTRYDELERLDYLRQLFFYQDSHELSKDIPNLIRQLGFIENARWQIDQVVFAALHIPGTNNGRMEILRSNADAALNEADRRDQANAEWLQQLFTTAESAQAAVIAFHADIFEFDYNKPACTPENRTECDGYRKIRELIKMQAVQFKKPVLLIHGDSQAYCLHQPYPNIPNLWRLNAPGDYKYSDASHIVFDVENKDAPFAVTNVLDQKPVPAICDYRLIGSSSPTFSPTSKESLS